MFAIEATNEKQWRWISGLFSKRSKAEQYLNSIPAPQRVHQRLVELPTTKYPVFVIEDHGFEYGGIDLIRARLRELKSCGDEDHIHINVFAVLEDFEPSTASVDNMGALLHWHITDWTLRPPRSAVFDQELQEIADET